MSTERKCFVTIRAFTKTDIATTKAVRTNYRAIKNARALYKAPQTSLIRDIKTQFFTQIENATSMDDGVSFFIHMTKIAMSSSIQLSMSGFKNILTFNPKEKNYHIPNINTNSPKTGFVTTPTTLQT